MISDYGSLQSAVADWSVRTDLTNVIPDFIDQTHIRLQEFVGPLVTIATPVETNPRYTLLNDTDTNVLLNYDAYVYLYGALAEAFAYLQDTDQLTVWLSKFQDRVNQLAVSGFKTGDDRTSLTGANKLQMKPVSKSPPPLFDVLYPYHVRPTDCDGDHE